MIKLDEQESKEMIGCLSNYIMHITSKDNNTHGLSEAYRAAWCINSLVADNTIPKVRQMAINAVTREIKKSSDEKRIGQLSILLSKLQEAMVKDTEEEVKELIRTYFKDERAIV